jgi:hypothetical protein
MTWDLGLRGAAYLLAMSVVFGLAAHMIAGRVTTRWLWLISTIGFFVLGLLISEGLFGWATEEDLQPNIDGLSRDEVLLGIFPGLAAVLLARSWALRRRDHRGLHRPRGRTA